MGKIKGSFFRSFFISVFASAVAVLAFSGVSAAKFYCPLGYKFSPKVQLCIGKGALKGYNTLPETKVHVTKGKHHVFVCPDNYSYSSKIQLCKGNGRLKGYTSQPDVLPLKKNNKKSASGTKNPAGKSGKNATQKSLASK